MDPRYLFHLLSDETRLRSVVLLLGEGELCVCELTYALNVIQPKISRHLAALRDAGLVCDRRQGQWIYYRVNPELPQWMQSILAETGRACADQLPFRSDYESLCAMPNRPGASCCA
jgi:ArsR family transcriptional regulator